MVTKTIRTVSVDLNKWNAAQQRTDNMSALIDELLTKWIETTDKQDKNSKVEQMKLEKREAELKLAAANAIIEKLKKEKHRDAPTLTYHSDGSIVDHKKRTREFQDGRIVPLRDDEK